MIGLALVTLFAVLAQGLRGSDRHAVEQQVTRRLRRAGRRRPRHAPDLRRPRAPRRAGRTVSAVRYDRGRRRHVERRRQRRRQQRRDRRPLRLDARLRRDARVASGRTSAVLQQSFASATTTSASATGSRSRPPPASRSRSGSPASTTRRSSTRSSTASSISQATFDQRVPAPAGPVRLRARSGRASATLESALAGYPAAKVLTLDGFVEERSAFVGQFLNLVYVLLALSIVVSLFGMVNTLVLSVFERTRELGMLRAVGMTRRQARRMVRHESVITALIGAAIGLPLGLLLAAVVTRRLSDYGVTYQVPFGSLAVFLAVAVVAGLAAALLPARRAPG